MKFIAVGDNVVDCYLDQKMYYPGGNAVNVAVNCSRHGASPVAYMGVFGDDPEAEHIKRCLEKENVTWDYSRKTYAASGHPGVNLTPDGDRVFVGGPKDTAQHIFRIRLMPKDLAYIGGFDLCHTSCYSGIEPELPALAAACPVSFDFSVSNTDEYIRTVAPHIRFAFFSGSDLEEKRIEEIIELCHALGTEVVGVTLGSRGASFSRLGRRYSQPIKPAEKVVDTMGAGDSFIAGFLVKYYDNGDMEESLDFAAGCAAETCGFHGGFGYPHPFEE
ncbi:PfkB family carbohydrate kinase [Breznakiella homolactica]|uniref:Carbohydrate kinase n=1 Tax=Breznakiella homolactica TaxID=2798577 RepID=A0A7T7XJE3_9SPIR|nr:PfkB family carbohydrate kinase [Breznakiella homolactica]QQO07390.1 carbohydrate kinase [Breznakiella homolactica]